MPIRAATPEDGRRAYDAGNFKDAMGIWAELSRQGNAKGEFGLGLMYDLGNGTQQNAESAFFWYQLAAEAGLPEAEFNVGAMYDGGRGVAQDTAAAALWYAKAAAHGHHRAQFNLALLYEDGDGLPQNHDAAVTWLRKASKGGIAAATTHLKALEGTAAARPVGEITTVALAAPARSATFTPTGGDPLIELVWVAPAEPQPVHFEIEVLELGSPTVRTVYKGSTTETAAVVQLPASADFYVWNIITVGQDGKRAPANWSWFSVDPIRRSEQSSADLRGRLHQGQ